MFYALPLRLSLQSLGRCRLPSPLLPADPHNGPMTPSPSLLAPVPHAVALEGTHAYLALGANGLEAYDLSDPDPPGETGGLEGQAATGEVAVHSNVAYVEADEGLRILDLSDPSGPKAIGFKNVRDGSIDDITVADSTAYLEYDGKFVILDLSAPSQPTESARISGSHGIAVAGDYAYTAGDPMRVFDVSDPTAPKKVGEFAPDEGIPFSDVAVTGQHAYLLRGSELTVLDVSRPADPQQVNTLSLPVAPMSSSLQDLEIQGTYAYVNGEKRLHVLDLSDPTLPKEVATVATGSTRRLVVADRYAYLVSGNGALVHRVDISDPTRPRRDGLFDPGGQVWGVAVGEKYVCVGGGAAGLYLVTWDGGPHRETP